MKVIIRADSDPVIGAGHVMRCLALADQLRSLGWQCQFAGRPQTVQLSALADSGHAVVVLDEGPDDSTALMNADPGGCDWLIVDHYGWSSVEEQACRGWATRIMVVDDLALQIHDCDVLVDQTLGRTSADYRPLLGPRCRMLLGSQYALLRRQFLTQRTAALARRHKSQHQPRRLLVSLGATDNDNVTAFVLHAIAGLLAEVSVDVVLGEQAPHLKTIQALLENTQAHNARLRVAVEDMATLMRDADLAIGAAGSSAWERCCLGLPAVLINAADNQSAVAAALGEHGAASTLGAIGELTPERLNEAVHHLLENRDQYKAMSLAAAEVCDGRGCLRVAAALTGDALAADGRVVVLRVATRNDAERMLKWQREPASRQFARNPKAPDTDEHMQWLDQKLSDPDCLLFIPELAGVPAGVLRLDWREPRKGWEISILVASTHQRLGIGAAALELARRLIVKGNLWAFVMPANIGSQRLFERAGYLPVDDGWYLNNAASAGAKPCTP